MARRWSLSQYSVQAAGQGQPVAGVVLTTTSTPLPFAGTNVVIPIEDVLADAGTGSAIDLDRLKVAYRHGQLAAMGGSTVTLKVAPDGHAATLYLPGKPPWRVTGKARIAVLQRLVEAWAAGTPHVNTKALVPRAARVMASVSKAPVPSLLQRSRPRRCCAGTCFSTVWAASSRPSSASS